MLAWMTLFRSLPLSLVGTIFGNIRQRTVGWIMTSSSVLVFASRYDNRHDAQEWHLLQMSQLQRRLEVPKPWLHYFEVRRRICHSCLIFHYCSPWCDCLATASSYRHYCSCWSFFWRGSCRAVTLAWLWRELTQGDPKLKMETKRSRRQRTDIAALLTASVLLRRQQFNDAMTASVLLVR